MIFGRKKDNDSHEEKEEQPVPAALKKKVKICDVSGCSEEAVRTVSAEKARKAGLSISKSKGKVHLCKKHYKEFKKATKKDRELERLGW
jgi:hypothetical protein